MFLMTDKHLEKVLIDNVSRNGAQRRSSSADRSSFGPLRVRHDDNIKVPSSRSGRSSVSGNSRQSTGGRSLSGSRASVGGRPSISTSRKSMQPTNRFGQQNRLSRGSGMGTRGNGVPKDLLPVSNKGFQHKCTQNILQFLTERGYPHQITPKILQSPTSKDFHKIFEFIYGHVCPMYKTPSKPEEDIPRIFKTIGYPIMITRSSMFAIGSPHTWPHILAALNFLVEWVRHGIGVNDHGYDQLMMVDDVFNGASDEHLFFKYLEQAYISFMDGNDTFEDMDAELKLAITRKAHAEEGSMESLMDEITSLESQLDMLERDTDRLKNAKQTHEVMQNDMEVLTNYLTNLEIHRKKLGQDLTEVDGKCATLCEELEAENNKIARMQQIYEAQTFTPEDVERINMKRQELLRQREDVEHSCQTIDEEIWKEEVAMTKEMEQIESKCQQYNKIAYGLKLIPITAENSCGIDYEMKKPSFSEGEMWDFNSTIKPALMTLKSHCAESVNMKESEKIKLSEKLEQAMDYMSDVQNELCLIEGKYKRAEEEFEAKKQLKQKEMQNMQSTVEDLQNEMVHFNSEILLSETDASREKKKLEAWSHQEKEKSHKKLQEYTHFFEQALQIFMDHIDSVNTLIKETADRSERMREEAEQKSNMDT